MAAVVASLLAVGTTTAASMTRHSTGPMPDASAGSLNHVTGRSPTARIPSPDRLKRSLSHAHRSASEAHLLVHIPRTMAIHRRPSFDAPAIGVLPSRSKYYRVGITAWIEKLSRDGRWGRVELPYVWPRRAGWIPLRELPLDRTFVEVRVDLSRHWVNVMKSGRTVAGFRTATGSRSSPTPTGAYFVTDRIPFAAGGALGSFAFGISGIQPHLPEGWSGGDQLAIHGTDDPSSVGTSTSAGCLRVGERALRRLRPLLKLGTPVLIQP